MIDPKKYRVSPDATAENVDDGDVLFKGAPLTGDRIAEVVADARRANLVPGGKSLSGDGRHSPVVKIRVSQTTLDELRALAAARDVSVAKATRELVEHSLRAS